MSKVSSCYKFSDVYNSKQIKLYYFSEYFSKYGPPKLTQLYPRFGIATPCCKFIFFSPFFLWAPVGDF